MQPLDFTARIPAEILLQVFDSACLDEFRRIMRVSRRWRQLARCHPTFWAAPRLVGTSPADVSFFLARISAGAGKPMNIELNVVEPDVPLLETTVLPGIASQLGCYTALSLRVHINYARAVFDLLRGPASSLRSLGILFEASTDTGASSFVTLPDDILPYGCHPQGMETVYLQNLVVARVPPALGTAPNVMYCQKSRSVSTGILTLTEAFPHVRYLMLSGRGLRYMLHYAWPIRWERLASLTLSVGRHSLQKILFTVPLMHILHLTTDQTQQGALSVMLTHLPGGLYMSFEVINAREFVLHLTSAVTGQIRSLRERRSAWAAAESPPHDALRMDDVVSRVVSLTIPVSLWELLLPCMGPFPNLETLTLLLSRNSGHAQLMRDRSPDPLALVCPRLTVLVLDGANDSWSIPLPDVKRIILRHLTAPTPVNLVLRCNWRGIFSQLQPVVDTVHETYEQVDHFPKTPWNRY